MRKSIEQLKSTTRPYCVPPSPDVMATLFMEYRRTGKMKTMSFKQYLVSIGFTDPAADIVGMDDAARFTHGPAGSQLIDIPSHPVTGKLNVKVLLVDFSDRQGVLPAQHYADMLFSKAVFPTGSMHDFYQEVSLGNVDVSGTVDGWFRMPKPYSYYTNNESGMGDASYPHNAQRMAEDAVNAALKQGVTFGSDLDKLNQGVITALLIIHAGRGAEEMHPTVSGREIWSHKWNLKKPIGVGNGLYATIYLTVPYDCKVGVCAHELGHLAFQWQDFYDPNYDEDGKEWDGAGAWDLMAGGSWNGDGARPAHPVGLHKIQHGWVPVTTVTTSKKLTLKPYTAASGRVYKIASANYDPKQYLLLENRKKSGFDFSLPGEGLLVWRVDERGEQDAPDAPGLLLIQADGRHDLEKPKDWNEGDAGDPFPGQAGRKILKDSGAISSSFPGGKRSGISLENITLDPKTGNITLDVKFATVKPKVSRKPSVARKNAAAKPDREKTPPKRRS